MSLSGRLAKVENSLHCTDSGTEKVCSHFEYFKYLLNFNFFKQKILEVKKDRLLEQLEEAKRLKDDIDRRGLLVSKFLTNNLTQEEYADYDYFINMKAKLIVDSKEIADKIKLGEEQLSSLKETLVHSEC